MDGTRVRRWFEGWRVRGRNRRRCLWGRGKLRGLERERREGEGGAGVLFAGGEKLRRLFSGVGGAFAGMGRELAAAFPGILARLDSQSERLRSQFGGKSFGRRGREMSHRDAIFGQVWLGAMMGDVLGACGVKPEAVIGYSLGETTGLFATRAWRERDVMLERMEESELFTDELCGAV